MTAPAFSYPGSELELFQSASNWKNYVNVVVRPWLGSRVLEVGAGIGGTTEVLCNGESVEWTCLEPDPSQCRRIAKRIGGGELPSTCRTVNGCLEDLDESDRFDTILYMDVLEHIEDDRSELARAASHLNRGGHLAVLAPAHNWLFTPFDRAVGHYRRYSAASLLDLTPTGMECALRRYLDSAGIFLSLGNRLLLRKSMPTEGNIRFWDRFVVPVSHRIDPLLGYSLGKSVLVVWRRV